MRDAWHFEQKMRRITRIFLVATFALMQCVLPFAHAQVGGGHFGQGLHIHEVQQQLEHLQTLQSGGVNAHAPDAAAVTTPQSKPRLGVLHVFDHPMVHGYEVALPAPASFSLPARYTDAGSFLPSPFRKQHPQAPPSL